MILIKCIYYRGNVLIVCRLKVGVGAVCLEANRKRPCGVDVVCWVVGVYVAAGGCGVDESPLTW